MDNEVKLVFGFKFTKLQLKDLAKKEVNGSDDLNGWFLYDNNTSYVNLGSDEIKGKSETTFVRWFTKVSTHELIHDLINNETNNDSANETEEKMVELMCGQRKWEAT